VTLPDERVPFPVAPVFRIRPDMHRWPEGDRGYLRLDARYPAYFDEKLRLLGADPAGCRVLSPDAEPDGVEGALVRVAEALAEDAASRGGAGPVPVAVDARTLRFPLLGVVLDREGLDASAAGTAPGEGPRPPALRALGARALAHLAQLPPLERLADALALAVQEDLVIVRADAPGAGPEAGPAGHAELLHVCFPSGWDPASRAGADFAALHAPVPHGRVLQRAAPQVVRAMVSKGPFVRYVWSLAPDARLDRNPRRHADLRAAVPPEALWFRVERQTVMPLPELRRALFTIRVYMAPLPAVLTGAERRSTLAAAVASMDEALLAYKGIGEGKDALLAWLEPRGATAS